VLYDLLSYRKITRLTLVALAVCVAGVGLQTHFVGSGVGSYVDQHLHPTLRTLAVNLALYARVLAGFWVAATRTPFSLFVLATIGPLTLAGLFYRYKHGLTIVEAFLAPYLAVVLLWPFAAGVRIVFPFIPWMVFLALTGLRSLMARLAPRYSAAAVGTLVFVIAIPYTIAYRSTDFGPIRQDSGLADFNQLCQAVRDDTSPHDVLIYFRARALSLYTNRPGSTYNYHGTEQELWQYARDIHATYLITTKAFHDDEGFLHRYVEEYSSSLELTYENPHFRLYRIRSQTNAQNLPTPH